MKWHTPLFWQKRGLVAYALLPLAWLYQLGYRARRGWNRLQTLDIPVICVGNLVAGGAGKTPVALAIGAILKQRNIHACFLSKAYGGTLKSPTRITTAHTAAEAGDEPLLLARVLPVFVAKNRKEGIKYIKEQGFKCIVMDDGFQNPSIRATLSLVVVDRAYGFGNGFTLPAGPLREPASFGLKRADAVVLVDRGGKSSIESIPFHVIHANLSMTLQKTIAGKPVYAFCGIARPAPFFASLAEHGAIITGQRIFADHHPYTAQDIEALKHTASAMNAELITTAKDAVRLPEAIRSKVLIADLALTWQNAADMETFLQRVGL